VTDYIPNNPDCPKCWGSGLDCTRPVYWFSFRNCHCQHPGLVLLAHLAEGIEDARAGRVVSRGSFAEYADRKPITFTDAEGREWRVVSRLPFRTVTDGAGIAHTAQELKERDATPDDLARAGYVTEEAIGGSHLARLERLTERVAGRDDRELEAWRALEQHVRAGRTTELSNGLTRERLKAIDEAREKKP
jgi:hypothetical protein